MTRSGTTARDYIQLIRPHQWAKNLLVLTPLFFSGRWQQPEFYSSLAALLAFSLVASSGYILNDIFDRNLDRNHPTKRSRPIASGRVSISRGLILLGILMCAGFSVAFSTNTSLVEVLGCYLAAQIAYSIFLKHHAIADLLVLSAAYLLRVLAGVAATGIHPSGWILIVTGFTALMLVTGKRYLEIVAHGVTKGVTNGEATRPVLALYPENFLLHLMTSTGIALLIAYLLWCSENVSLGRFSGPAIFPTAGVVAYGILRYLLLVYSKTFDEDPTRGLLRDVPIVCCSIVFFVWIGLITR